VPEWSQLPQTNRDLIVRLVVDLLARWVTDPGLAAMAGAGVPAVGGERDDRAQACGGGGHVGKDLGGSS
jgi:hypothetical protein